MKTPALARKAAVALLAMIPLPCEAADPIGAVQAASVVVVVKGVRGADSAPVEAQGSGFFTSRDGYLVTSYHLVSDLLDRGVNEKTLTYNVMMAGQQTRLSAFLAWKGEAVDLMVLRARIGNMTVHPLEPDLAARAEIRLTETPVFTGGFPGGYEFVADRGYIKSFEGPENAAAPAWVTNMTFKEGQSGSPVVMEDGRVVAVVKAVDLDATSIGILVPVWDIPLNYWKGSDTAPQADQPKGRASAYPRYSSSGVPASLPEANFGPPLPAAPTAQDLQIYAAIAAALAVMAAWLLLRKPAASRSGRRRRLMRRLRLFFALNPARKTVRGGRQRPQRKGAHIDCFFSTASCWEDPILQPHQKRAPLRRG